ncbi:conserved Plasmodium protein, unknown function [Plasmodium gallinaceum]|uniref:Cytoplasmic tRNA 2-thiolation protein 2 n=1 Tax=Plasmodium gallinaceum TaxID=5849 RepID=A0A1J1GQ18_PLAGA|nr:conserved Plasmodium protein, unknown function [Plasmodium gallinaceum]CRG94605.1 conserved Plasmodium protein, unknown function [Plasmodium gallinaceum]
MNDEDKILENKTDINKVKINSSLCYKCKKLNAVIYTREKSCKDCFIKLVEYTFKNTLREKCLFKSKIGNNFLYGKKVIQKKIKEGEKEGILIDNIKKSIEEENEKYVCKSKDIIIANNKKKNTALAFSGEICSCFLLFLFVKYLNNFKNKKNDLFLMNEHSIFTEIIFVDIYDDKKYICNLINTIEKIFEILKENDLKRDINNNEEKEKFINYEEEKNVFMNNDDLIYNNGVFKKKINKVNFIVLKSNYFISDNYKDQYTMNYDIIKKEKNYYINYINQIIIYNNIIKYCINENIKYVLFGNNANNISNKSFLYTILGNGINLPLCASYIDNRYSDIHFIKPLKDLLNKEIYIYCYYKNINYLNNTTFDGNILHKSINDMLSNLDDKNNTTSIINNTVNNLINMVNYFNIDNNTKSLENKYFKGFEESSNENENLKNYNLASCYICLGKKETIEEKNFIKKMDKIQLSNIKKMKYTNLVCSTCLSIFSCNNNFVNFYNIILPFNTLVLKTIS